MKLWVLIIKHNIEPLKNQIEETLLGLAIGDAMGVPVEFCSRETLQLDPVLGFRGYGTHTQLPGTFSDDSSLCFCLVESLIEGFTLENLAQKMVSWRYDHYWTANGYAFDCGNNISEALEKLRNHHSPKYSGNYTERSNSNGSLMRILPLVFYLENKPLNHRYRMIKEISSLTHAHDRSILSCFYLIEFALELMTTKESSDAFKKHRDGFLDKCQLLGVGEGELRYFHRLLDERFSKMDISQISSTGYVIDTLEAAIWCLLNNSNYSDTILNAVNLCGDTDTIGCIAGGLAGLTYGLDENSQIWREQLKRNADIKELSLRYSEMLSKG